MYLAPWALGLWLCYATLQNLIPSFPWRNPRQGRDQILPSGNLASHQVAQFFAALSPIAALYHNKVHVADLAGLGGLPGDRHGLTGILCGRGTRNRRRRLSASIPHPSPIEENWPQSISTIVREDSHLTNFDSCFLEDKCFLMRLALLSTFRNCS